MDQDRVTQAGLNHRLPVAPAHSHTHTHALTRPQPPLTCWGAAAEGRGGGDGRGHRGSKASTAVAGWRGHIPPRHGAGQGQRELRLDLLLEGLLLSAGSVRHEPAGTVAGE